MYVSISYHWVHCVDFFVYDSTKQYATKAEDDCGLVNLCKSFYTQTTTLFETPTTTSPTIIRCLHY